MRNIITLLLLLFVYINTSFAQLTSSKFRVNFKVDEFNIDEQDKLILDEIVALSQKTKYCEISLSAHTDNDADDGYNVRLSKNRAQAVTDYLVSKGLNRKTIDIKWFGEKKPELDNKDASNKAVNRRVDIELKQYQFNQLSDLLKTTGGNYTQTFTLSNADQTVIKGKNGTQIIIPKDALVTKDGKSVPAEQVVVELQEYQKPMDAIYNNLTTICDGKILESGGMFKITAKYNGEELVVKKGQTLPVEMPSTNIKPDMELYIGYTNPHQAIEWKQEKTPFEIKRKNPIKAPTTKVNENFLKTLLLPLEGVYTLEAKNVYTLPYIPGKPYTPTYPKKSSTVTEEDLFNATERFFYSKAKKERMVNEEQKKRDDIYERRVASYERRMEKYKQDMETYYQDTVTYNKELNKFYSWISDEITKYEKNITLLEKKLFNASVKKLIYLSENNKLTTMNPQEILLNKFDADDKNVISIKTMTYRINVLQWLLKLPIEEINKLKNNDKFNYMAYKVHASYAKRAVGYFNFGNQWNNNKYAGTMIEKNKDLAKLLVDARLDIMDQRKKLGLLEYNDISNIYTTSLKGMGYVNCDKFANYPLSAMTTIEVKASNLAQVSFYLKNSNSMISASRQANGTYTVSLPRGTEVSLLVIELQDGIPMFEKRKMVISNAETIVAQPEQVTIKEMCSALLTI